MGERNTTGCLDGFVAVNVHFTEPWTADSWDQGLRPLGRIANHGTENQVTPFTSEDEVINVIGSVFNVLESGHRVIEATFVADGSVGPRPRRPLDR
ncbi:MAG: hypothetical protein HZB55_11395 [Deltaproteobacteria bacterium]|nr:hypothetical protein [Deltaproteobacteria bacterium]